MVRIVNYLKRQAEDGREFFVLEISGGIDSNLYPRPITFTLGLNVNF